MTEMIEPDWLDAPAVLDTVPPTADHAEQSAETVPFIVRYWRGGALMGYRQELWEIAASRNGVMTGVTPLYPKGQDS